MFNLHIGLPGIFPGLFQSMENTNFSGQTSWIVPSDSWKTQLRSVVNGKVKMSDFFTFGLNEIVEKISNEADYGTVAASQHAMLGSQADCFQKDRLLPQAARRIQRVSKIFKTVPITFHITLVSQSEYLQTTTQSIEDAYEIFATKNIPSWTELISCIRAAAPKQKIIVWDFQEPDKVILMFLAHMLNVQDDRQLGALKLYLSKTRSQEKTISMLQRWPKENAEFIHQIDLDYAYNLTEIEALEGVSVVLPKHVPEGFHL